MKNSGVKLVHAPIGLGIALRIPNPALAIKPWIAPRLDVVRVSVGSSSNTERTSASAEAWISACWAASALALLRPDLGGQRL